MNSPWFFRPARAAAPAVRLFCFAHAGGAAAAYRLWPEGLPAGVEVVALQLPGRANRLREPPVASIPRLVELLTAELDGHLDLPFLFFGHSMGALLAWETARALAARGAPLPVHLILSGRRGPRVPMRETRLHALADDAFLAEIGRRYGGIPAEILQHPDVLELVLPALRADIAAIETFEAGERAPLSVPITVFGGADDSLATAEELAAWQGETDRPVRVKLFPGGHFYLETARAALLEEITAIIAPLIELPRRAAAR